MSKISQYYEEELKEIYAWDLWTWYNNPIAFIENFMEIQTLTSYQNKLIKELLDADPAKLKFYSSFQTPLKWALNDFE